MSTVEHLLTVEDVLQRLRISRSKLHELVRAGEIRAVKVGRRALFREKSLAEFIEAHETRVAPASAKVRGL